MRTLHTVVDTGPGQPIPIDVYPIGWQKTLVPLAHLSRLGDANDIQLQLMGVVVLPLRLENRHFRVPFIGTKHLAASMIIGTKF